MTKVEYERIHCTEAAPDNMSMDRLGELDELVVAQTTQMCFRKGCCTPSINWVLLNSSNYDLTAAASAGPSSSSPSSLNPFDLPSVGGWIHEESTFFQRCCCHLPACRETSFVQHSGLPPASLGSEDCHLCVVQTGPASSFLTHHERTSNIVAIHEKPMTCPSSGPCCHLPYLRTLDHQRRYLGETRYVCDECIFVPKFTVLDKNRTPKYLLRPDTCFHGLCVRCRFGGPQGKCARLPFLIRDPITGIPIHGKQTADGEDHAQVTGLWSGLANEVCFKRHAYHVAFPEQQHGIQCSVEDKLVLIGAAVFIDVALFEKNDNDK